MIDYEKHKPELMTFILVILGIPMMARIGLDFLDSRYILSVPFMILLYIVFLLYRKEHKKNYGTK